MEFYKKQIEYYNHTAYKILTNEIGLIQPTFLMDKRPTRSAILAFVLGGIASSVIVCHMKVSLVSYIIREQSSKQSRESHGKKKE